MAVILTNNAKSTLAAGINNAVTTIPIQSSDAEKFPSPGAGQWFPLTVVDAAGNMEIMRCTGRSGASLTVTRAQEGTTAKAFADGSSIDIRLTVAVLAEIYSSIASKQPLLGYTPLDRAGGDMEDRLEIIDADPSLWINRVGTKRARFHIDAFGNLLWHDQGGQIHFYIGNNGELWSQQTGDVASAIAARVAKSGDTMSGPLEIMSGEPALWLHRPGVKRARFHIDAFGSLLWQDQTGQVHFYVTSSGAVWTQQFGDLNTRIETRAAAFADNRVASLSYRLVSLGEVGGAGELDVPNGAVCVGLRTNGNGSVLVVKYRYPQVFDPVRGWIGFANA